MAKPTGKLIRTTPESIGALPVGGTAVLASKLAIARKINGMAFDGSADITLTPAAIGALTDVQAAQKYALRSIKINGKPLSVDVNLLASDVNAWNKTEADGRYLGKTATAAASTKLATARKINGVAFDGSADITLKPQDIGLGSVGLVPVALLQFSSCRLKEVEFKAIDASTLEATFDIASRGRFVEMGKTRLFLLNQSVSTAMPRHEIVGKFVVTALNAPNSDTMSTTIRISYPGHGVAVGSRKTYRLAGFIYRELGGAWNGHVSTASGLLYSYIMKLNQSVAINTPILTSCSQDVYTFDNTFGTRTLGTDHHAAIVNASMINTDTIGFSVVDNNGDSSVDTDFATLVVYDIK